jgi:Type III restriction enzyme, res subunit
MFFALMLTPNLKVPIDKLKEYDLNIQEYEKKLSAGRATRVSLKYFQYLAALFSEIYFDSYFQDPISFLNEINGYVSSSPNPFEGYSRRDLRKIAYWMATGSGKTFIMHVNYFQFLKYNVGPHKMDIENVILVTPPGELLAQQHLRDLQESGIRAEVFEREATVGYFVSDEQERTKVKVIEISKLKLPEDKKGEGVTVDVTNFGSKNLLFVDEGHKGHASEDRKWKRIRQVLAQDGFTLEYSATFGQAISRGSSKDVSEYSKSILFDFSYKYFFTAGYGKDFQIHYMDPDKFNENSIDTILLANMLAFYEQTRIFESRKTALAEYNISKPLWIFVGHRVQEDKSDLLPIVNFFGRLLSNAGSWPEKTMARILEGKSGIIGMNQRDLFARQTPERNYTFLRSQENDGKRMLHDVLRDVFHIPDGASPGKLHIVDIKNASGQIGLRAGGSTQIFGLIDIGNKSDFLNYLREIAPNDFIIESDAFSQSLFGIIEEPDSPINVLIGAKKFIEGWNSWRVSCMGLLNVGRNEGAQIIQLFGRGVRLKGKYNCLKRSRALHSNAPEYLEVLETLNVFGIRASYLETFRGVIKAEELPDVDIVIQTVPIEPFPSDLYLLRLTKSAQAFVNESAIVFEPTKMEVKVDLLPRAKGIDSRTLEPMYASEGERAPPKTIPGRILELLDWEDILQEVMRVKTDREWSNALVTKENLHRVITEGKYQLFCNDELLDVRSYADLAKVGNLVVLVLTKYLERWYLQERRFWKRNNIALDKLSPGDPAINKEYVVKVKESDTPSIETITKLRESGEIYKEGEFTPIQNVYFDKHIFQPLLRKMNDTITLTPELLNKGELEFVRDLRDFIVASPQEFTDKTVFLLRNLSRGSGIGFIEEDTFYPDFILWVLNSQQQLISFIDPKGLIFFPDLDDFKLTLYQYLQNEVEPQLRNPSVRLNAFIVSDTPFHSLKLRYRERERWKIEDYAERHILFQETRENLKNPDYIQRMFEIIQADSLRAQPN